MLETTGDVIMDKELECQQAMRVISTAGNMVYAAVVHDGSNPVMRIVCYVEDGLTSPVTHGAIRCYFPTKKLMERASYAQLDLNNTATSVVLKGSGTEIVRDCIMKMLVSLRSVLENVYNISFSTIDYAGMDYLRYHWDRLFAGVSLLVIEGTSSVLDDNPTSEGLSKPEAVGGNTDEGDETGADSGSGDVVGEDQLNPAKSS